MDERALWDRIRAEPDADAPRLVYADWLQERGEPGGELIAIECELARIDPRTPRGQELTERSFALGDAWWRGWLERARRVVPLLDNVLLRRGLPEGVRGRPEILLAYAGELAEAVPFLRLMDTWEGAGFDDLLQAPVVDRLEVLRVTGLSRQRVARLAACPRLRGLRTLELNACEVASEGVAALAAGEALGGLESLVMGGCGVDNEGAAVLATGAFPALRDLSLGANRVDRAGAAALARRPWRSLILSGNPIGSDGAEALAASPALAGIERLDLSRTRIGPSGVFALAASPHLASLRALELGGNDIGERGERALLDSPFLSRELILSVWRPTPALHERFAVVVSAVGAQRP